MNSFRITIEQFKENMLELCANSKAAQMYSNLSTQAKATLTRVYHKLHPDPIAKHKIKGLIKYNFLDTELAPKDKFDPDIESVEDKNSEENVEEEEEEKEEIITKTKGKTKGKPKTKRSKPSKKQTQKKTQKKTKKTRKTKKSKNESSEISESI